MYPSRKTRQICAAPETQQQDEGLLPHRPCLANGMHCLFAFPGSSAFGSRRPSPPVPRFGSCGRYLDARAGAAPPAPSAFKSKQTVPCGTRRGPQQGHNSCSLVYHTFLQKYTMRFRRIKSCFPPLFLVILLGCRPIQRRRSPRVEVAQLRRQFQIRPLRHHA